MNKLVYFLCLMSFFLVNQIAHTQDKKVLFEEFTNASCGPCAANNPTLKAYIDSKGDTIVAIKYHTNFPGFDPMYNHNPTQVDQRRGGYYSDVNAVPWLKGDGNMFPDIWPFTLANLDAAFNTRKAITPLLLISVADERIAGDSIRSTITVIVPQDLPAGNYRLRVMATEKEIVYPTPPGTNGERIFEHVFRKGLPDMTGTVQPVAQNSYSYIFKYKIESEWINANINTVAFVQNDDGNKEVLNCAVSSITTGIASNQTEILQQFSLSQNYPNPFNPVTNLEFEIPDLPARNQNGFGAFNSGGGFVTLKIYNSLGKEVAVLVNEKLSPGNYKVKFDASNIPSGVYFYKIDAGDFSDIKKMTLIK